MPNVPKDDEPVKHDIRAPELFPELFYKELSLARPVFCRHLQHVPFCDNIAFSFRAIGCIP
jgi:hypothetical protein